MACVPVPKRHKRRAVEIDGVVGVGVEHQPTTSGDTSKLLAYDLDRETERLNIRR